MSAPEPLETLFEDELDRRIPLTAELERLYGELRLGSSGAGPYVIGNFVSTMDGVVALNTRQHESGAEISGSDPGDRMVMGILRAISDAVVVGAGTLRAVPRGLWTAEFIFPPLAEEYRKLRRDAGMHTSPLHVFVTGSGTIDLAMRVFQTPDIESLIVTKTGGEAMLRTQTEPDCVRIVAVDREQICAADILQAVADTRESGVVLVEGGPHLFSDFIHERLLDELFLTIAPQIGGRTDANCRPGFTAGRLFAPYEPVWTRLVSLKRAKDFLFLRYALPR